MPITLPPEPVMWTLLVVSGSFAVAVVLELADVPRTLRSQWRRWRH